MQRGQISVEEDCDLSHFFKLVDTARELLGSEKSGRYSFIPDMATVMRVTHDHSVM